MTNQVDIFIPDGSDETTAMKRTTHLAVGAHQDDIEIMAYPAIAECYQKTDKWFTGVVLSDGAGSPRTGDMKKLKAQEMAKLRLEEQKEAAKLGEYSIQIQLGCPSSEVKDPKCDKVIDELHKIFEFAQPEKVFLHNPADRHPTHVAACLRCIAALRRMPKTKKPKEVLGLEVWRSLDWLSPRDLVVLPCEAYPKLAIDLVKVFDSQISGGKRLDLASQGRRYANASFHESHAVDSAKAQVFGVNLLPLIEDPQLSVLDFTLGWIDRFRKEVEETISHL